MKLTHALAWLGVTPFTISLILKVIDHPLFGVTAIELFAHYSLVIVCFMAGTLWGQVVTNPRDNVYHKVLVYSNLLTLTAFFSFLSLTLYAFIYAASFLFLLLLVAEAFLGKNRTMVLGSYWALRIKVTAVVCAHHLIFIVLS